MPVNLLVRTSQFDILLKFIEQLIIVMVPGIAINPKPVVVKWAVGQNTVADVSTFLVIPSGLSNLVIHI